MTTYNGYELNYSIEELEKMTSTEMTDVVLLSKDAPAYLNLDQTDKKVLEHLVKAAKILNNVALIQDNSENIILKSLLEKEAAKNNEHAKLALKLFNSLNGVYGLNGVDDKPVAIFKNLTTTKGKNFYPKDLSVEEFHNILLDMFTNNQIDEIKKILDDFFEKYTIIDAKNNFYSFIGGFCMDLQKHVFKKEIFEDDSVLRIHFRIVHIINNEEIKYKKL